MRSANAPTQLMQLCQTQLIRAIDNDGVRGRHVNAALHDRRTDEQIGALVIEIEHHLFELTFTHLPVTDRNASFWHELRKRSRGLFDGVHAVVDEIDLTAAPDLAKARLANGRGVPLRNKCLDGES